MSWYLNFTKIAVLILSTAFNSKQDVYKSPFDDTTFHAVFTTNSNGLRGSAICSFRLEDMETVFDGKFKEQATRFGQKISRPV